MITELTTGTVVKVLTASIVIYVTANLFRFDPERRKRYYEEPLAGMPQNSNDLIAEMLDVSDVSDVSDIFKTVAYGAVLQRNHDMATTRSTLSYAGQFVSWFMKQRGLSPAEIENKYRNNHSADEISIYTLMIQSASRANPNLFQKFMTKIKEKLNLTGN